MDDVTTDAPATEAPADYEPDYKPAPPTPEELLATIQTLHVLLNTIIHDNRVWQARCEYLIDNALYNMKKVTTMKKRAKKK